jgi:pimeloyl-ACP methyl ester carboxylesterase
MARLAPDVPVIAADLPGRGSSPAPLSGVTVGRCVDEVVQQIEHAGLAEVVLVGHSLAGIVLPGVATALGARRVRRLVFLTCSIPPEGGTVVDVLRGPLRAVAALAARRRSPTSLPKFVALAAFGNGMSRAQHRVIADALCPEAGWLMREPVSRAGLDPTIPRTWVLTRRDRAITPVQQGRSIANLGGVDECVELDAPHDAMVSHPEELAGILLERVAATGNRIVCDSISDRDGKADDQLVPGNGRSSSSALGPLGLLDPVPPVRAR